MTRSIKSETFVYGGAFNPPTIAHAEVIEECLKIPSCSEIWVMPSGQRTDKAIQIANEDRLRMLGLLCSGASDSARVQICDVELSDAVTRTWQTVERFEQLFPDKDFRYVFGADSYWSMPEWVKGAELQTRLPLVVIGRDGSEPIQAPNVANITINVDLGVSSSEARRRVKMGEALTSVLSPEIGDYVLQNGLYVSP